MEIEVSPNKSSTFNELIYSVCYRCGISSRWIFGFENTQLRNCKYLLYCPSQKRRKSVLTYHFMIFAMTYLPVVSTHQAQGRIIIKMRLKCWRFSFIDLKCHSIDWNLILCDFCWLFVYYWIIWHFRLTKFAHWSLVNTNVVKKLSCH